MKKVIRFRHHDEFRPGLMGGHPGLDIRDRHQLVGCALNDQPGHRRLLRQGCTQHIHRGCDSHELTGPGGARHARGHHRAERKAGQPELRGGPARPDIVGDSPGVSCLAFAVSIRAFTRTHPTKIEAQRGQSQLIHRARQRVHHLVKHRALIQRMRMTQHRHRGRVGDSLVGWHFQHGLQTTRRAVDEQGFFFRSSGHAVRSFPVRGFNRERQYYNDRR